MTALLGVLSPSLLPPLTVFAAAIPVLIGLERGRHWMLGAALAGTITGIWTITSIAQPLTVNLVDIGLLFVAPTLLAMVFGATGSLNLCFQLAVLASALGLVVVHLVLDDPVGFWVPMVDSVVASLSKAGVQMQSDPETVTAGLAKVMWSAFAALTLCTVLSALWLGRWWQSLLRAPGSFGREFQQLRLGVVLGIGASIVLLMTLVTDSTLVDSLVGTVFIALSLQGLAAAHRSRARAGWNRGWLAAIYVLLIVSMPITVMALAVWGFADNWARPRTQNI